MTPIKTPLTLSTVDPSTGSNNGGYTINVQGTGFPLAAPMATITIGGVQAQIVSISNILATVVVPPSTLTNVATLVNAYNALTATASFTYTAPIQVAEIF